MVFIGDPIQCGKATFANEIIKVYPYKEGQKDVYFKGMTKIEKR